MSGIPTFGPLQTPRPLLPHRLARAALAAALTLLCVAADADEGSRIESAAVLPPLPQVALQAETAVVVTKHSRSLVVLRRGALLRSFPIVLGMRPVGAKRYEGDLRTPEGTYRVTDKRAHSRWRFFIEIDYPNSADETAYRTEVSAGKIPLFANRLPGVGGNVGIHGSDRPAEQAAGTDWTKGCIALSNEDVEFVYDAVAVGTPVVVLP